MLNDQLDRLEKAQLVRPLAEEERAYIFKHALTQETAYGSLLVKRRREIHLRVAETIEQLDANDLDAQAGVLAEHYAEAGDDARTAKFALRAGDLARAVYAYAEARAHYTQALEAMARLPDGEANRRRRIDTVLKQVAVSLRSDGPERNLERLREAESLLDSLSPGEGDRERRAYLQYWIAHCHVHAGRFGEGIKYMRQVLAAAQEGVGGPELLATPASVIGRALAIQGRFSEGEALLRQAIEPLEQAGNWPEWFLTVSILGTCLAAQGRISAGFAEAERGLRQAEEIHSLVGMAHCHSGLALISWQNEDYEQMRREGDAMAAVAEKGGDHLLIYNGLGYSAWAQAWLGNYAAAEEEMERALRLGKTIAPRLVFLDMFMAARAEMALLAGRVDDAVVRARDALDLAREVQSLLSEGVAERVWGTALASAQPSNRGDAEPHFSASLRAFETGHAWLEAARTDAAWARMLQACGEEEAARQHMEKATELGRKM